MERASGFSRDAIVGQVLGDVFPSFRNSRLDEGVSDALTAGLSRMLSESLHGLVFPLRRADGRPLGHNVLVRCLEVGGERHCLIQVHDVTAHREAEAALRASEERARIQLLEVETLYNTAPIGLGLFDRDIRFLRVNEALAEMNGASVEEHVGRVAWDVVPTLRAAAEPVFRRVFETGEQIRGVEVRGATPARPGVERVWIEDFYPLHSLEGEVVAVGVIVREVTEQRRLEERERLLKSELHHRIKNLFTMVGAVAQQTARTAPAVPDFMERFGGRLRAMAAAQNLLAGGEGQPATTLPDIVRTALAPFLAEAERVVLDLDAVAVPPDVASDLALALHELATNATKYGALSAHAGRVALTGRAKERNGEPWLCLEWRESDGPPVTRPGRKGFGSRLLERSIAAQRGGMVEMDWHATGLVCRVCLPLGPARP